MEEVSGSNPLRSTTNRSPQGVVLLYNEIDMVARILVGLLICVIGWLLVWKTMWFVMMLGYNSWAEAHLGGGGTTLLYKLMGTAIIIIGFMVMTNLFESFIVGLLGGIFGAG